MNAFPHLRIVGKKIPIPPRIVPNKILRNPVFDEIIAIDPNPNISKEYIEPPQKIRQSFAVLDRVLENKSRISNQESWRNNDIEKCIRITSGYHKWSNPNPRKNQPANKFQGNLDSASNLKIKSATACINKSNEVLLEKRERAWIKVSDTTSKSSKSASFKSGSIFLPSLDRTQTKLDEVIGRSISAISKKPI